MTRRVPRWVRIGLFVLAAGQLVTGLWAVLATRNWFEEFPGIGARLVAADPPYNAHLAADAGAGFLATGVALLAAAIWAERVGVYVAVLAYLAQAVPHLVFHLRHPADALTVGEQLLNVALLGGGVVLAIALGWGAHARPVPPHTGAPVDAAPGAAIPWRGSGHQ
jgi:hypothetical protein